MFVDINQVYYLRDWTTLAAPIIIISGKVVSILQTQRFRGWTTYPVNLLGRDREHIPDFHGLAILGRCGPLQPERSAAITVQGPSGSQVEVFKGRYFDETKWDGSDLFMPNDGTGLVFMMPSVRDALRRAKATGALIALAVEHERVSR
jgi:hypothetical protein